MKKKKTPPELIPGTQKAILIAIDGPTESVIAHTNQMLFLGYHAFVEAGKQGIDLSTLISLSGKLSPELKKVLQNIKKRNKELKKSVPSNSNFLGLRAPRDFDSKIL